MIKQKLTKVLSGLDCHDKELSILLIDDNGIAKLNQQYLGKTGPTNVLAFPMAETPDSDDSIMLGDVVISIDTAMRESEKLDEPFTQTIFRLLIHGILHLLGYDHTLSPDEETRMQREEERLLKLILED